MTTTVEQWKAHQLASPLRNLQQVYSKVGFEFTSEAEARAYSSELILKNESLPSCTGKVNVLLWFSLLPVTSYYYCLCKVFRNMF